MKAYLFPYKKGSNSAAAIADALGIQRIKLQNSRFKPSHRKLVLNWGMGASDIQGQPNWLNPPGAVALATSKRHSLHELAMAGVPTLEATTDSVEVARWLCEDGVDVIARKKDRGHAGDGIVVLKACTDKPLEETYREVVMPVGRCSVYTKYFKAKEEYRVHVVDGQAIDVQQKRKRADIEQVNYHVRNHDGGFVFCREDVNCPQCCIDAAVQAVDVLGLDFGAVDVRYNEHYNRAAVLEVNTAPGLEGTTLQLYTQALGELFQRAGVEV